MATEITDATNRLTLKPAIPRRRFHLLDAMILVAATALACGITVWIERGWDSSASDLPAPPITSPQPPPPVITNNQQILDFVFEASFELILLTLPFFAIWTLALIPIRLLFPGPRLQRLGAPARYEGHVRRWDGVFVLAAAVWYSPFRQFTP